VQIELLVLQSWMNETGQQAVITFEGRDAAGNGFIASLVIMAVIAAGLFLTFKHKKWL